jgi:ABC-2 type transport system permease protein
VIGVAVGCITRSTLAAVVGAVGWVLFVETIIVHNVAPHLANWLVSGAAAALTDPGVLASRALTPATAVAVLSSYSAVLLTAASWLVLRRDVATAQRLPWAAHSPGKSAGAATRRRDVARFVLVR